jgi:hypothetical protein
VGVIEPIARKIVNWSLTCSLTQRQKRDGVISEGHVDSMSFENLIILIIC